MGKGHSSHVLLLQYQAQTQRKQRKIKIGQLMGYRLTENYLFSQHLNEKIQSLQKEEEVNPIKFLF